jgi:hypothetical protein
VKDGIVLVGSFRDVTINSPKGSSLRPYYQALPICLFDYGLICEHELTRKSQKVHRIVSEALRLQIHVSNEEELQRIRITFLKAYALGCLRMPYLKISGRKMIYTVCGSTEIQAKVKR